jgi:uncharacterized protein YggL (DUF469 family)
LRAAARLLTSGAEVRAALFGSATEEDRAALAAFLEGDDAVVRHEVGALRDAWYAWD